MTRTPRARLALSLRLAAATLAVSALTAHGAAAQEMGAAAMMPSPAPQCSALPRPHIATPASQQEAAQLLVRARRAALVGDTVTARERLTSAERLDPSNAAIAYERARVYESTSPAEAIVDYCRFLALAPQAPNTGAARAALARLAARTGASAPSSQGTGAGAAGARTGAGVTAGASDTLTRTAPTTSSMTPSLHRYDPAGALARGLLVPGFGQYYTGRPLFGGVVLAGTAAALIYGLQSGTTNQSRTFTDPNGYKHTYTVPVAGGHPHITVGVATALAVMAAGAVEAYFYAKHAGGAPARHRSTAALHGGHIAISPLVAPLIAPGARGVGIGLSLRHALP